MSEDLTYSSLHEMMMKKFKFESNSQINLSFKLSSFDCNVDITDDAEDFAMVAKVRSNADFTRSISKLIFVTNFPDDTTSKVLWSVCQTYGTVVGVFIPNRKSKAGKRFAFVRFIRVDNVDRLVGNLCTLWIGRMHLHANVARFERTMNPPPRTVQPSQSDCPGVFTFASALQGNARPRLYISPLPAMVLDDSCVVERDLEDFVMGIPLHAWSRATFAKICSKWGEVIELEECKDDLFARKRICIKTKLEDNILEKFKIIIRRKIFVIRAKELFAWSPVFKDVEEVVYCSDDESFNGGEASKGENKNNMNTVNETDDDAVFDTCFGEHDGADAVPSEVEKSIPFPLGFTPENSKDAANEQESIENEAAKSHNRSVCSRIVEDVHEFDADLGSNVRGSAHVQKKGGSVLELLDDIIKVGQAMGYSMEGCEKDIEGGLLCVWDSSVFLIENHTISDNFVVLYGTWKPTKTKLLVISVYAPQALSKKRLLWNYISLLISRWGSECIVMGDFNEVHCEEERTGLVFNVQGANVFNDFISSSSLIDVRLEGYSFTWSHPSATKMSKLDRFLISDGFTSLFPHMSALCLDKHLSDHRPILLWDVFIDYGATRFNGMVRFKKKLQLLKKEIWMWVLAQKHQNLGRVNDIKTKLNEIDIKLDQGGVNDEILHSRLNLMKQLHDHKASDGREFPDPKFVSDYRPISLIGSFYKVVTKILATCLSVVISELIFDVQTAFFPSRQILDGSFIINELLAWYKHHKHQAMVFKVDLAKAYDSIRWDYLVDVLRSFGFGDKWCSYIKGSLSSSMASILVNGSPTLEFQFHRGLKQGDPLAPYLFILVMESLHLSFSRVVKTASGLKINVKKSHLLGVGISHAITSAATMKLGCSVMKTPFKYLGVMVGSNMLRINAWDEIICKMNSRLSKWKLKTLSIGGRLTLLKSVLGSSPIYSMSLYKVPKTLLYVMESICRNFFNGIQGEDKKITWVKWSKVLAELNKDICVADKLQLLVESSFRRPVRGGIESHQLEQLLELLGLVILSNSCDRWLVPCCVRPVIPVMKMCLILSSVVPWRLMFLEIKKFFRLQSLGKR
nr:RNA-directed DNA polymerase, eukaryota [Tanacetum cinerariifolium]